MQHETAPTRVDGSHPQRYAPLVEAVAHVVQRAFESVERFRRHTMFRTRVNFDVQAVATITAKRLRRHFAAVTGRIRRKVEKPQQDSAEPSRRQASRQITDLEPEVGQSSHATRTRQFTHVTQQGAQVGAAVDRRGDIGQRIDQAALGRCRGRRGQQVRQPSERIVPEQFFTRGKQAPTRVADELQQMLEIGLVGPRHELHRLQAVLHGIVVFAHIGMVLLQCAAGIRERVFARRRRRTQALDDIDHHVAERGGHAAMLQCLLRLMHGKLRFLRDLTPVPCCTTQSPGCQHGRHGHGNHHHDPSAHVPVLWFRASDATRRTTTLTAVDAQGKPPEVPRSRLCGMMRRETFGNGARMKVLVIGGGAREHALAWKLAQSPRVTEVLVAPGNAGTACEPRVRNAAVATGDIDGLLALADSETVALTVVGPEAPLAAGIVDRFRAAGHRCFGPRRLAAQLESSKAFAKDFLFRHNIPTARHATFDTLAPALDYVRRHGAPIVIKADGLAAGKGVVVALTLADAQLALHDMLGAHAFGDASARVVIEEYLEGEEASYIVLADGRNALPLATSQDHKRLHDNDLGPNTGGMGAYSPAPVITAAVEQRILREIVEPTLAGMAGEGAPFVGFLYVGLMIDATGAPHVIEFNVRLGDPETQPLLLRLNSDLVDLVEAALDGRLAKTRANWSPQPALGVVLAAAGYPGKPRTGDEILGLDTPPGMGCKVFHAGTRLDTLGRTVTDGGRIMTVCAMGDDIATARTRAYAAVSGITFAGCQFRHDIGHRALQRK